MRASSLYFALGTARVAVCAPMARSLTSHMDKVSDTGPGVATPPPIWSTLNKQDDAPGPARHDSAPPRSLDGDTQHLSKHRTPRASQETPKMDGTGVPRPVHEESDILQRLEIRATGSHQPGIPCQGVSDTERNNMLIVFLAMVFFVMVVVMEACGSVFRRQGAIRLEEPTNQTPLSIRATPHGQDGIGDEKRRM